MADSSTPDSYPEAGTLSENKLLKAEYLKKQKEQIVQEVQKRQDFCPFAPVCSFCFYLFPHLLSHQETASRLELEAR